ncbi:MAG: hypothetical protein EXS42_05020 [Lacunisphaera sp.]|nr:hypothetical protein [Lacunisphaera sp.]
MKAIKLLLASALLVGFATLSFTGPDYWARTQKIEKEQAQARTQAKVQATAQVAVCAICSCPAMKKI